MKRIIIALAAVLVMTSAVAVSAGGSAAPDTSAKSAILTCDGEVLFAKNAEEELPMASTTKIMTCIIALEMCDPDEVVTVSYPASLTEGSSLYLKEGDTATVRDLVYDMLLPSSNDAATALARHIGAKILANQ